MATHTLTLEIPDELYQDLERQAATFNQTVEDLVLQRASTSLNKEPSDRLPEDLERKLTALEILDDKKLWRAARSHLSLKAQKRLQSLHFKRQAEGALSSVEDLEAAELVRQAEEIMVIRAQAAVLLKQRGYDITELGPKM